MTPCFIACFPYCWVAAGPTLSRRSHGRRQPRPRLTRAAACGESMNRLFEQISPAAHKRPNENKMNEELSLLYLGVLAMRSPWFRRTRSAGALDRYLPAID